VAAEGLRALGGREGVRGIEDLARRLVAVGRLGGANLRVRLELHRREHNLVPCLRGLVVVPVIHDVGDSAA